MKRKTVCGLMLALLLGAILQLAFKIRPARADGTIYIRPDGSVDPPTAKIHRDMNVYTMTGDINGSIVVERDDILIDGRGHLLQGAAPDIGIDISGRRNVTIRSVIVAGFFSGLLLDNSHNNTLFNNTVVDNEQGIELSNSYYNLLSNNTVSNSIERAISLKSSSYNTLSNNRVMNNSYGIGLYAGTGNILRKNAMVENRYAFGAGFVTLSAYIHDVDTSNTIDGKPIYYWIGRSDEIVPSDAGTVIIVGSSNITVRDLRLTGSIAGVHLAYTGGSLIENVTATGNYNGIILDHSNDNRVVGNNLSDNEAGISVAYATYNSVAHNFVSNNEWTGIHIEDASHTTIVGNEVANNRGGGDQLTVKQREGAGIWVDDSSYCNITGNNVINNVRGIVISMEPGGYLSNFNLVSSNNISENGAGIVFFGGKYNEIYHNNFVDNWMQILAYSRASNIWDTGYPDGGNYWSDYNGTDLFSGMHQNQTGIDGMGDTSYIIDENNQDHYPLMNPWSPTDISITNTSVSSAEIYSGRSINITVDILNKGTIPETFEVICAYKLEEVEHSVGSTLVSNLSANAATTVIFNLTTTTVGAHIITVEATILPDETDPTDNKVITSVRVKMWGDVNGDNKIDIKDIAAAASAFGLYPDDPGWNTQADINQDNKVDIRDLALIAKNFGRTYP